MSQERKKQHLNIRAFTHRTFVVFFSMLLLSDVGVAAGRYEVKIAQEQPQSQEAIRTRAERLFDEAVQLSKQGTAESRRQAIEKFKQALPLMRQGSEKVGEAVTIDSIARLYSDLGDKQQALNYYNQSLALWQKIPNKQGEALALNNIGFLYRDLGNKQQALNYYKLVLPLWQQLDDKKFEAVTLNAIGSLYDDLGEKQQAVKYFNQSLPLWRQLGYKVQEASTLSSIATIYSVLGDKQKALNYYNLALPLSQQLPDKTEQAINLYSIGKVYSDLGDNQQALNYYNLALPLSQKLSNKRLEANILNNIASVYSALGEKQKALDNFNLVLLLNQKQDNKVGQAATLNNIGTVYSDLGDRQQALKYYNQALPLSQQVQDKSQEATTLINIGTVYSDLGDNQQALKYYNEALPLWRQLQDKQGEATTLNNIGRVHDALGDNQQALKDFNQALPLSQQIGDKTLEATILSNIGAVYHLLGDKQQALDYYNQALPLRRQVGDKEGEANTLNNIAVTERDRGNLQAALTQIKAAIDIIENLRTKVNSQDLRTSYFASQQKTYKLYIDLLMQLHKKDPSKGYDAQALHISERSRARVLLELLTEAKVGIRKDVDPKLLAEETRLQQLIDAKEKLRFDLVNSLKIEDPTAKANAQKLQKEVWDLLNQQKELQTKIRTSSPKYAALKYPEPLKLSEIQQQLDKDTLLLEYSLGEERSYLWAVTPTSITSYELPKRAEIEAAAKDFYKLLNNPSNNIYSRGGINPEPVSNANSANVKSAIQLSQMLLQPVASQLGNKRLLIVGDGALQYVPFAALPDLTPDLTPQPPSLRGKGEKDKLPSPTREQDKLPSPTREQDKLPSPGREQDKLPSPGRGGAGGEVNSQPLLVNHEIVNQPSATAIALQRQELKARKLAPKTLAILADPVFSAEDERVTDKSQGSVRNLNLEQSTLNRAARNLNRNGWKRLDGTRKEAETISQLVPESNRLSVYDFDANYNWTSSQQLQQYRYLHFATHGFVDSTNPELSGIVLSLFDKQGKPVRGYLRLGDIFNLNLPAELLVLSACETGLGKEVSGEGLVGLTRGLMYAGAARVVVSLWKVDDKGTSMLMQEFYKEMLQQGRSPTAALRAAQLKMWQQENWRNPYYWSAFTFQGEWR